MISFRFNAIVFTLAAFVFFPAAAASQNSAGGIRITISKAPKPQDGNAPEEERAVDIRAAVLEKAAASEDGNPMLAAVFDQSVGTGEVFRLKVENGFSEGWSLLLVELSADRSCNTVLPFYAFTGAGLTDDRDVPIESVAAKGSAVSPWLSESVGGTQRFAVIAAPDDKALRDVFMAVEFLAGLATGRAAPATGNLAELKLGMPKGKVEAGEEYRVKGSAITITLGSVYSESGETLRPAAFYDALLLIAGCRYQYKGGQVPLDALRVGWLNNRGLANYQTGNLAESKTDYETALELLAKLSEADRKPRVFERLVTTTNLAQVYATLGDQKSAIAKYRGAEGLAAKLNPAEIEQQMVSVFGGLGTSLEFERKYEEALANYEKALAITRRHGMEASEGIVLNSLGRLAAVSGKRPEAEKYFQQAISLSERTRNHAGVGSASNNLGWFYVQDKRYADAHAAFVRSSEIFSDLGNRTAEATALGNLMFVERLQNRPDTAIFFGKKAIRLLQSVRGGLTNIEKQLQRSFLLSREETYRTLADILISRGRLIEAQAIIELVKDEEFGGKVRTRSGETTEIAPYTEAEELIQDKIDELAGLRAERIQLQAERTRLGESFSKQAELDSIDKSISLVNAAFRRSLERLAAMEASVSERVKVILGERNLQTVLSTLKKENDTEAVALYTVIGTEDVGDTAAGAKQRKTRTKFGWTVLVTATDRKAYPIDVSTLEETVRRLREALASDRFDPKPDAQKLYTAIFRQSAPSQRTTLEKDLDAALAKSVNKTVMWSLDGVLRYVPVAALHDGKQYLVEKFRNVVFTSQSLGQLQAANSPKWKVLGLGVSEARPGFGALAGAKDELEFIIHAGMFEGTILLNEKFRKDETLRVWRDKTYPVIHIASHFKFHPTKPDESYLLIGDGELKIADIENEDNLFDGVDLLALSACDTAMTSNGKESESFAYLAQDLGAKTVLASLWPVSDAGTPELMTRFYTLRAANTQMTKGEAFHRAQISLLRGEKISQTPVSSTPVTKNAAAGTVGSDVRAEPLVTGVTAAKLLPFVTDPKRPFGHPFYWAPFILIGNWR